MIELSKNYVALNMTKFIYEEEAKAGKKLEQDKIKQHIFDLYEECLVVIEENDQAYYEFEEDCDDAEAEYLNDQIKPQ